MSKLEAAGTWRVCREAHGREGSDWLGERPAGCAQTLSPSREVWGPGTVDTGADLDFRPDVLPPAGTAKSQGELQNSNQPQGLLWDPEFTSGSPG